MKQGVDRWIWRRHRKVLKLGLARMNNANSDRTLQDAELAATGTILKIGRFRRSMIPVLDALFFPYVRAVNLFQKPAPRKQDDEIRKILVIEYTKLGDIVLLLPFLHNLRIHYPLAQITLLVDPKAIPLLKEQNLVDELIAVRVPLAMYSSRLQRYNPFSPLWASFLRCLSLLRKREFDLAFVGKADIFQNLMLWMTRAGRRVGYGFRGGRIFLTDVATPNVSNPHVADCWLALLQTQGKPVLERLPRLNILPGENHVASDYLARKGIQSGEFIIGIHSGVGTPIRQWGVENFREVAERVIRRFGVKILWFQDPGAGDQANESPLGSIPVTLELRQFVAVLARCQLLICNDSGPMHIASALGVPVVAPFGPTEPSWYGPLGIGNRIVIHRGFWCRPCGEQCIFDKPYCLRTISVDEVFEATVETILGIPGARCLDKDKVKTIPAKLEDRVTSQTAHRDRT
jgi:ADP-heptose:LPS heptosyltransferase